MQQRLERVEGNEGVKRDATVRTGGFQIFFWLS
jgi:hypothetical protein